MNKHYQEVINVEDYEKFLDVPMSIEVELGSTKISLKELLNLEKKSVIDLENQLVKMLKYM
jgi:flagellar motor switch/type III secretory pathway protein FliN